MLLDRLTIQKTLLLLSLGLLVFDALTGFLYFTFGINSNLSTLYKLIIVFLCFIYSFGLDGKSKEYKLNLTILFFCVIWALSININDSNISYFVRDIGDAIKMASLFIVYATFSRFSYFNSERYLVKVMGIAFLVLFFNVLATKFGFGQASYSDYGAKGFFQSGNSLSSILILISSFLFVPLYRKKLLYFFVALLLMIVLSYSIGTKSGMLGVLLCGLSVMILNVRISIKSILIVFLAFGLLFSSSIILIQSLFESAFYDRFIFMYEQRGFFSAVLSGRDLFFNEIAPYFFNSNFHSLIFGLGTNGLSVFDKPAVEMDWFDMLFKFGFLITLIYFILLVFLINDLRKIPSGVSELVGNLKNSALISTYLLIVVSFISGHVILNGVVTFFWAVLISLPKQCYINRK